MRSSSRGGWFYESARHSLASRGIRTGRGYFSQRRYNANLESGPTKSFLATPIGMDPMTGQKIYPTKADGDIPYAPKKRLAKFDFSNPATVDALALQRESLRQRYSSAPANFSRLLPMQTVADESAAPTMPPLPPVQRLNTPPFPSPVQRSPVTPQLQRSLPEPEPEMEPEMPVEEEYPPQKPESPTPAPVREMPKEPMLPGASGASNVIDSVRGVADRTIPSWMQKAAITTPSVPPERRSLQDESFEVTY